MARLRRSVAFLGTRPPWIIALLVASLAALRASDQYVLALVCLAAATTLLSTKIIQSAISHDPYSTVVRGVLSVIGALTVVGVAVAIGIGLRPRIVPAATHPLESIEKPAGLRAAERNTPEALTQPGERPDAGSNAGSRARGEDSPVVRENRTLFLDCRMGTMPRKPPPSNRIFALVPQPLPEENGGGGLLEYFVQPGGEWRWDGTAEWAYRCELTNYTGFLLLDVNMDFHYDMRRPVAVADNPRALGQGGEITLSRAWPISIAKIDVGTGDPFVFYIQNCCQDRFVFFKGPSHARATIGGQPAQLQVQQSARNLFEPLSPTSLFEKK